jgi:hypothetical protein
MIVPAMYWSASAGGIQAENTNRKNSQANSAIENGLTSQLMNSVTKRPRGRFPTSRIAAKSTFIIMGMIISQMRTAIGMLIWLLLPNSNRRNPSMRTGSSLPKSTPTIMQTATQRSGTARSSSASWPQRPLLK